VGAADVLGPDVAGQAVLDVVGQLDRVRLVLNGIRQATGPKISSCAICMRLSTSANTVGQT
jgi:hypothetical protein